MSGKKYISPVSRSHSDIIEVNEEEEGKDFWALIGGREAYATGKRLKVLVVAFTLFIRYWVLASFYFILVLTEEIQEFCLNLRESREKNLKKNNIIFNAKELSDVQIIKNVLLLDLYFLRT